MSSHIILKCAIKSQASSAYLSLTCPSISSSTTHGSGTAASSKILEYSSTLYLDMYCNGTFAIRCPSMPGAFLRADFSALEQGKTYESSGAGAVSCQYYKTGFPTPATYECFRLHTLPNGSNAIESTCFPGCYLRINGDGKVNGQWYGGKEPSEGSCEAFAVLLLS